MDWRGIRWLIEAMDPIYGTMLNIGVWVKSTPGQGSFLRSQHEFVAIYRVGEGRGRVPCLRAREKEARQRELELF
jgi:hypothetical protein